MTNTIRTLALGAAAIALSGCAKSLRLQTMPVASTPAVGIPYALNLAQFRIETTYRLAKCGAKAEIAVASEAAEIIQAPDAEHTYLIDPNSLAGLFRTGKVEVKYHPDGSVASLNAEGEDRTAEAVVGFAKTAASIVKLAAAPGNAALNQTPEVCSTDALAALLAYDTQKAALKQLITDQADALVAFDKAKARIDSAGALADQAMRQQYSDAFRALSTLTDRLAVGKKALERLAGPLTLTRTKYWPTNASERTFPFKATYADLLPGFAIWLANPTSGPSEPNDLKKYDIAFAISKVRENALSAPEPTQAGQPVEGADGAGKTGFALWRGVPYRIPQPGRLTIVRPNDEAGQPKPETLFEKTYTFPQLGRILQLPCVVPAFSKGSCFVEFAASGQPTRIGTTRDKAPGEAIATMAAGIAEQAVSANEALVKASETRSSAAQKEQEQELKSLQLQAQIRDARAALVVSPPGERTLRQDQLIDLQLDLQLIEARRALDAARDLDP